MGSPWVLIDIDASGLCEIERDDEACGPGCLWTDDDAVRAARREAREGSLEAVIAAAIHQHDKGPLRGYRRGAGGQS